MDNIVHVDDDDDHHHDYDDEFNIVIPEITQHLF